MRPELPGVCVRRNNASLARMITGATVVLLAFSFVPSTCDWRSLGSSDRSDALFHGWAYAMKKAPSVVCVAAVPPVRVTESGSGRSQERLADVPSRPAEEQVVIEDDHMSSSEASRELRQVEEKLQMLNSGILDEVMGPATIALTALASYLQSAHSPVAQLVHCPSLRHAAAATGVTALAYVAHLLARYRRYNQLSRRLVTSRFDVALQRGDRSQRRKARQKLIQSASRPAAPYLEIASVIASALSMIAWMRFRYHVLPV